MSGEKRNVPVGILDEEALKRLEEKVTFHQVKTVEGPSVKDGEGVDYCAGLGLNDYLREIAEIQKLQDPTTRVRVTLEFTEAGNLQAMREDSLRPSFAGGLVQPQDFSQKQRADKAIDTWVAKKGGGWFPEETSRKKPEGTPKETIKGIAEEFSKGG